MWRPSKSAIVAASGGRTGYFHCPGLFAESGHILRPVIDLIILLVTAPEGTNSMVVVEKFNVVKEDFGLYHLAGQCRGQSVPVRVNHHKTGLAHSQRRISISWLLLRILLKSRMPMRFMSGWMNLIPILWMIF